MAHLHEMRDSDNHFIIDPATMVITNKSKKHKLQQGDHNSEIYSFEIPRQLEGHDMTLCNLVQIHYINIKADKTEQQSDVYNVTDMVVCDPEADTLVFTWTVHGNATKFDGTLSFRIHFYCIDDHGEYKYKKHTEIFKGISISEGFDNAAAVENDNSDILSQWESRLDALEQGNINTADHSMYFDIDVDGLISLKRKYRGATTDYYVNTGKYTFSESDRGIGFEGSEISELPERLVIPNNVDGEMVTGFQPAMFCCNHRVKEVVLPSHIRSLPGGMFREAIHLEKVENTEQIESIGSGGFQNTRIEEIRFPNLVSMNNNVFRNCTCLRLIDIGQIANIGDATFEHCINLTEVLGGANVKIISKGAFYATRRLKSLSFLKNVTSVNNLAFFSSRCDFEEVYDTMVANGCEFKGTATYKQFNDTDYWTGVTFEPHRVPLVSVFHQKDPRWADKYIGNTVDENGERCTYGSNGCGLITLAEIYSAFEGVHFDSPEEFWTVLEEKNLTQYDYRYSDQWCQIAEGLGYTTEYISTMTKAGLQTVYDALADGALLFKSVGVATSSGAQPKGGHTTLVYGINSAGEMLMSDTAMHSNEIGIYENHKTAWHIYKHGSKECDVVIVKKSGGQ